MLEDKRKNLQNDYFKFEDDKYIKEKQEKFIKNLQSITNKLKK
jgi:hypothetical protein